MPKTLATLPSIKILAPASSLEYFEESSTRRWELTINWKTKLYLTDIEKEYFMAHLKAGKRIIQVGDMVLTKKFDCLIPVRQSGVRPLTEAEKEAIMAKARADMKKNG